MNETITLTATRTDEDGEVVSYEWRRGDEILATTPTFSYTPSTIGTDRLSLTVTDNDGASATDTINIIVKDTNQPPIANAGIDEDTKVNSIVTLIGKGEDVDGIISKYEWKEGNTLLGTNAILKYKPMVEGIHRLTLTVTDDDGAVGSDNG